MTEFIGQIIDADHRLFVWLNGMHAPWADTLMYWITFKYTWIPLYLLLIGITFFKTGTNGFFILFTVLLAVAFADQITSGLMKPFFLRLRPCYDPALGPIHVVGGCGGMYGFASSHASTSFALATSWFLLLKSKVGYLWLLFVWSSIYAYSRIYVGVHFPADVLVGTAVGLLSGWLCTRLYFIFLSKYARN